VLSSDGDPIENARVLSEISLPRWSGDRTKFETFLGIEFVDLQE
jgi:hypothetical protein